MITIKFSNLHLFKDIVFNIIWNTVINTTIRFEQIKLHPKESTNLDLPDTNKCLVSIVIDNKHHVPYTFYTSVQLTFISISTDLRSTRPLEPSVPLIKSRPATWPESFSSLVNGVVRPQRPLYHDQISIRFPKLTECPKISDDFIVFFCSLIEKTRDDYPLLNAQLVKKLNNPDIARQSHMYDETYKQIVQLFQEKSCEFVPPEYFAITYHAYLGIGEIDWDEIQKQIISSTTYLYPTPITSINKKIEI